MNGIFAYYGGGRERLEEIERGREEKRRREGRQIGMNRDGVNRATMSYVKFEESKRWNRILRYIVWGASAFRGAFKGEVGIFKQSMETHIFQKITYGT